MGFVLFIAAAALGCYAGRLAGRIDGELGGYRALRLCAVVAVTAVLLTSAIALESAP